MYVVNLTKKMCGYDGFLSDRGGEVALKPYSPEIIFILSQPCSRISRISLLESNHNERSVCGKRLWELCLLSPLGSYSTYLSLPYSHLRAFVLYSRSSPQLSNLEVLTSSSFSKKIWFLSTCPHCPPTRWCLHHFGSSAWGRMVRIQTGFDPF